MDSIKMPRETLLAYDSHIIESTQEPIASLKKKVLLPPIETKATIEAILNAYFPPREWGQGNKHFAQYVSHQQVKREDLIELIKILDCKLDQQSKGKGICPIREELHSQIFDEMIRQITIENPDMGALLIRVRDEMRLTLASYQTLYSSAILFGIKKKELSQEGKTELVNRINTLYKKKELLKNKETNLKNKIEAVEKRIKECNEIEEMKRNTEISFLNGQLQHLKAFINSLKEQK